MIFTVVVLISVREYRDANNKRLAFEIVCGLGGHVSSIPCWPFGDEIRVEFHGKQVSKKGSSD